MQRVLDSSPIFLPPVSVVPKRPLKRTASLASLPTPPRTTHKNKRSRKDVSDDDEEGQFEVTDSEHEVKPLARVLFKPKGTAGARRAKVEKLTEAEAEDAFWLGDDTTKEEPRQREKDKSRTSSTIGRTPVSPPPSRSNQVGPRFQTPPPLKQRALSPISSTGTPLPLPNDDDGPIRDSPNNVFLVDSKKAHPPLPVKDDEEEFEEQPTVRYTFRGKAIEVMNPFYNMPPEVHERSKLPLEHPEYSPPPTVQPKRLFAKELGMRSKTKTATKRRRSSTPPSPSAAAVARPTRKASPAKTRSSPRSKPSPKRKRAPSSKA